MKKQDAVEFEFIGEIAVDSGLIHISDPCYLTEGLGASWEKFVEDLGTESPTIKEHGDSTRLTVETHHGDGFYPVFAEMKNGRIRGIFIDFLPEEVGE